MGGMIFCILLGVLIPSPGTQLTASESWFHQFSKCDVWWGLLVSFSGACICWMNVLTIIAARELGVAIAFPIILSLGLVAPCVLDCWINPSSDMLTLACGTSAAIVAAVVGAFAHVISPYETPPLPPRRYRPHLSQRLHNLRNVSLMRNLVLTTSHETARNRSMRGLMCAAVASILSLMWSPCIIISIGGHLDVYTGLFWLMLGQAIGLFLFAALKLRSVKLVVSVFTSMDRGQNSLAWTAGCFDALGFVTNFLATQANSFATVFSIGMCAPVVTTLVGVFVFCELRGRSFRATVLTIVMMIFYTVAILCLSIGLGERHPLQQR